MSIGQLTERVAKAGNPIITITVCLFFIFSCLLLAIAVSCVVKAFLVLEPFVRWFIYGCIAFLCTLIGFISDFKD